MGTIARKSTAPASTPGASSEQRARDVRTVRKSNCDDTRRIELVVRARFPRRTSASSSGTLPQIVEVEYPFRKPAEEPRHAVLEHLAAGAQDPAPGISSAASGTRSCSLPPVPCSINRGRRARRRGGW